MYIGIPKEIKNHEDRVGITPAGVVSLVSSGHTVLVETGGGIASGFSDEAYVAAGAELVSAEKAWSADMVIKVKEPLDTEYKYFREGLILYTYLHLAANKPLTEALLKAKVTGVGYETMVGNDGSLPLLTPMSQIAGRMAIQQAAHFLEANHGGKGIMLSGVPGVRRGEVVIIGGGVVGTNAAKIAAGMGANVTILDRSAKRMDELENIFDGKVQTLMSNTHNITECVKNADVVVGAVLIPGRAAPKLVTEEMIKSMEPGSVVVDIPIDQGGIFETSHATTHDDPVYTVHNVIHYAVANIPGAVPQTATEALSAATIPYAVEMANLGLEAATKDNTVLTGVNTHAGKLTEKAVAESLDMEYTAFN